MFAVPALARCCNNGAVSWLALVGLNGLTVECRLSGIHCAHALRSRLAAWTVSDAAGSWSRRGLWGMIIRRLVQLLAASGMVIRHVAQLLAASRVDFSDFPPSYDTFCVVMLLPLLLFVAFVPAVCHRRRQYVCALAWCLLLLCCVNRPLHHAFHGR